MLDQKQQHYDSTAVAAAHAMRELLPDYATAIVLGQAGAPEYAALLAHLDTCIECQVDLDDLVEIVELAYIRDVNAAFAYPAANLAFLPPSHVLPWLVDAGRLLISFSEALLESLGPAALAGASRGQLLYRYVQEPGSVADMEVAIEVYAEQAEAHAGRVHVSVDVPTRGPFDQVGSTVVLHADEAIWRGETDESGSVDFAHVPLAALPRLRVEITPLGEL
jgi:hypothetical protein